MILSKGTDILERTITVTGTGKAVRNPDLTVVYFGLTSRDPDYSVALSSGEAKLSALKDALSGVGIDKKNVVTVNFDVRADYQSVRNKDGSFVNEFRGYVCSHDLKAEFGLDMPLLGKVLSAISEYDINPDIRTEFTIKDRSEINDEAVENAVRDASSKARLLAAAAGVALGDIVNVNYHYSGFVPASGTQLRSAKMMMASSGGFDEITPDKITVEDSVSIMWEIGGKAQ